MNKTFPEVKEFAKNACVEYGFGFINVYEIKDEAKVADGWDRFIVSPYHISDREWRYIGFVRQNGEFVGKAPKVQS